MTPTSTNTPAQALAITLGDPCGIGPEIIAKAFVQAPQAMHRCFVVGDAGVMRRCIASLHANGHLPRAPAVALISDPSEVEQCPQGAMPLYQIGDALPQLPMGKVHALAGRRAGDCVAWAAHAALERRVAAMVTAPLHKEALAAAGSPYDGFPGHTELLQAAAARHAGCTVAQMPVRMMLANDELRTVLVSIHVSLRRAIDAVTFANVLETLQITHRALGRMLGRPPRIAVSGLNPHAGEGGLFGDEEKLVIAPAIDAARQQGMRVEGPFPGDTVFMQARRSAASADPVDAVVAMYHDQGLIPVKYLGVENGVNVTLGLPLVRTSPDHGTAFDIAGKGLADPSSLLAAIRMARQLA